MAMAAGTGGGRSGNQSSIDEGGENVGGNGHLAVWLQIGDLS